VAKQLSLPFNSRLRTQGQGRIAHSARVMPCHVGTCRGGGSRRGDGGPTELSLLGTLGRGAAFTLPMASASGGGVEEEVVLKARGAVRCWRAPLGASADTQVRQEASLFATLFVFYMELPFRHAHLLERLCWGRRSLKLVTALSP
jgi:hypothetical protein